MQDDEKSKANEANITNKDIDKQSNDMPSPFNPAPLSSPLDRETKRAEKENATPTRSTATATANADNTMLASTNELVRISQAAIFITAKEVSHLPLSNRLDFLRKSKGYSDDELRAACTKAGLDYQTSLNGRDKVIAQAKGFIDNPQMKDVSLKDKVSFLKNKGLSDDEIRQVFNDYSRSSSSPKISQPAQEKPIAIQQNQQQSPPKPFQRAPIPTNQPSVINTKLNTLTKGLQTQKQFQRRVKEIMLSSIEIINQSMSGALKIKDTILIRSVSLICIGLKQSESLKLPLSNIVESSQLLHETLYSDYFNSVYSACKDTTLKETLIADILELCASSHRIIDSFISRTKFDDKLKGNASIPVIENISRSWLNITSLLQAILHMISFQTKKISITDGLSICRCIHSNFCTVAASEDYEFSAKVVMEWTHNIITTLSMKSVDIESKDTKIQFSLYIIAGLIRGGTEYGFGLGSDLLQCKPSLESDLRLAVRMSEISNVSDSNKLIGISNASGIACVYSFEGIDNKSIEILQGLANGLYNAALRCKGLTDCDAKTSAEERLQSVDDFVTKSNEFKLSSEIVSMIVNHLEKENSKPKSDTSNQESEEIRKWLLNRIHSHCTFIFESFNASDELDLRIVRSVFMQTVSTNPNEEKKPSLNTQSIGNLKRLLFANYISIVLICQALSPKWKEKDLLLAYDALAYVSFASVQVPNDRVLQDYMYLSLSMIEDKSKVYELILEDLEKDAEETKRPISWTHASRLHFFLSRFGDKYLLPVIVDAATKSGEAKGIGKYHWTFISIILLCISHPRQDLNQACNLWLSNLLTKGVGEGDVLMELDSSMKNNKSKKNQSIPTPPLRMCVVPAAFEALLSSFPESTPVGTVAYIISTTMTTLSNDPDIRAQPIARMGFKELVKAARKIIFVEREPSKAESEKIFIILALMFSSLKAVPLSILYSVLDDVTSLFHDVINAPESRATQSTLRDHFLSAISRCEDIPRRARLANYYMVEFQCGGIIATNENEEFNQQASL